MDTLERNFGGIKINGFLMLFLHLLVIPALIAGCFILLIPATIIVGAVLAVIWMILFAGYMKLEPNEARVMVFFRKI